MSFEVSAPEQGVQKIELSEVIPSGWRWLYGLMYGSEEIMKRKH